MPPLTAPTLLEVPGALIPQERSSGLGAPLPAPVVWDHLIYAYMVENTRAYEIFRRVLEEYLYGETLAVPSLAGERWLRTTEQLFYHDAPAFQIYSTTSWIRPDSRAARRNAYFRMFGFDLNHGADDGRPYPYVRPRAANTEFVATLEELLREVWAGIENFRNLVGANPTDPSTVSDLARRLFDMLRVRRLNGNLSRDEFSYVSMMSWLHLTLSYDTPIVTDLNAEATAPEERLFKIGARVGLPAHSRSASYFRLADSMSTFLRAIETAAFNNPAAAPLLYDATIPGNMQALLEDIVRDWSLATGRDMKARRVQVTAPQRRPLPAARPSTANGRVTVTREALEAETQ
jgi:hypothetical protein